MRFRSMRFGRPGKRPVTPVASDRKKRPQRATRQRLTELFLFCFSVPLRVCVCVCFSVSARLLDRWRRLAGPILGSRCRASVLFRFVERPPVGNEGVPMMAANGRFFDGALHIGTLVFAHNEFRLAGDHLGECLRFRTTLRFRRAISNDDRVNEEKKTDEKNRLDSRLVFLFFFFFLLSFQLQWEIRMARTAKPANQKVAALITRPPDRHPSVLFSFGFFFVLQFFE